MTIPSSSASSNPLRRMPPAVSADLATAWAFLEEGLDEIMANGIDYTTHLTLHGVAYNYCTSSRTHDARNWGAYASEVLCSALYERLVGYLAHHVKGVKEQSDRLRGEALLRYYASEWDRYTTRANYIHRVFAHLNLRWVKPAQKEGRAGVYPVYTLALVQWKSIFFHDGENGLADIIHRVIEGEWNGQPINHDHIKKVIDSFTSLGSDENVNTASL